MIRKFLSPLLVLSALALPAAAQTEAEFVTAFAGDWVVHDPLYGTAGQACQVGLGATPVEAGYALTVTGCTMELAELTHWTMAEGQMILHAGATPVAALGGTQHRISGNSAIGAPIVLDRAGAGTGDQIRAARQTSGCYYLGFTSSCADEAQLARPEPAADGSPARINILVNLNVRAEARDDAGVVGVVPAGSCVTTEACVATADGAWCRARFGEVTGWLKKLALRQERWPVITYANHCEG